MPFPDPDGTDDNVTVVPSQSDVGRQLKFMAEEVEPSLVSNRKVSGYPTGPAANRSQLLRV